MKKKCECGCGRRVAKLQHRYIHGHNQRGTTHEVSEATREKISIGNKGKITSQEARKKISIALLGRETLQITRDKLSLALKGNSNSAGHIVSSGTRKIMSEVKIGHEVSVATREKISKANKGRRPTSAEKRKISLSATGHVVSDETRRRISDANSGENWAKLHPFMKGYQLNNLKKDVRSRDGNRCILCKLSGCLPDVHHVVPVRIGYKSRLCDHKSNLMTLCHACHRKIEPLEGKGCGGQQKEFLSIAKKYLSRLGYKEMLLDNFIRTLNTLTCSDAQIKSKNMERVDGRTG